MRHTRAHTANRRSHHALKSGALTTDTKTGVTHLRHRASLDGTYKGRTVIGDPVKKVMKKQGKKPAAKKAAPKKAKKKSTKKK